jgi:hypothetical protein
VYSEDELDGDANTVGNVPMEWYQDYDHIGYNIFGQKLLKVCFWFCVIISLSIFKIALFLFANIVGGSGSIGSVFVA